MKKVLVIGHDTLSIDPRVNRQVHAFLHDHEVHTLGPDEFPDNRVKSHVLKSNLISSKSGVLDKIKRLPKFLFDKFEYSYFRPDYITEMVEELNKEEFSIIINNELFTLPLAVRLKNKNVHLHFDAHEYYMDYYKKGTKKKEEEEYLKTIFYRYIPQCDTFSTVCQGIADLYKSELKKTFEVVENFPLYHPELKPKSTENIIRLVHHGAALRDRNLEALIELMEHLGEGYSMDIYLYPSEKDYFEEFKMTYNGKLNVKVHGPIEMPKIPEEINNYDIGVCAVEPISLNYKYGLGNKYWEFLQGRLAVATTGSVEMENFTRKNEVGVFAPEYDIEGLAKAIKELQKEDIQRIKQKVHSFAEEWSVNSTIKKYRQIILEEK